jgi:hypothetical protein
MRIVVSVSAALLLVGCAQPVGTGMLAAGSNVFTLTEPAAPVIGGADDAMRTALRKATDFCTDNGRVFAPTNMGRTTNAANSTGPITGYTVTFRCDSSNDFAAANHFERAPKTVVEQANR